jgi:hypothetical protein
MVWSPMSNLLLYGATSRVKSAREHGVRIGIGSDWAVSGSKNLLGELKVARLASDDLGTGFSDRDIVAMATRDAAAILGWQQALGSIRPGARADLIVLDSTPDDPYRALVRAVETSLTLVMINGVPRFGTPSLLTRLGVTADGERLTVGGRQRMVYLEQESGDEVVAGVSLSQARRTLVDSFRRLPELARDLENGRSGPLRVFSERLARSGPPVWFLALDELEPSGIELRPRLPGAAGRTTGPTLTSARAVPLSQLVTPMTLDPLTVADDSQFLDRVEAQTVLPDFVRTELKRLY